MNSEPLLSEIPRNALYPLRYPDLWDIYNKHKSTFWTAEEVDLSEDVKDWEKLNTNEQFYLEMVLGFFAISDFIVNEHLATNFIDRIKVRELQMYYDFQKMMENIHSTTYADLINTYVKDENRKIELFNASENFPCIKKKADWARKYICGTENVYSNEEDDVRRWVTRLVVFSAVEGIFFSGSFCAIFWMKKRGMLPGLTFANELISRDEGIHRDMACYIYKNHIVNKLPKEVVIDIVKDAVKIEQEFVVDSLPVDLIGMNSRLMCQYIEYVADHLLLNMIGERVYNTENPFEWMVLISLENKANFFEKKVTNYAKAEVKEISFNSDF